MWIDQWYCGRGLSALDSQLTANFASHTPVQQLPYRMTTLFFWFAASQGGLAMRRGATKSWEAVRRSWDGPSLGLPNRKSVQEHVVLALTILRVVILLDAARFPFLACLLRNGEMRRVYLSGKLLVFWQEGHPDSFRS